MDLLSQELAAALAISGTSHVSVMASALRGPMPSAKATAVGASLEAQLAGEQEALLAEELRTLDVLVRENSSLRSRAQADASAIADLEV